MNAIISDIKRFAVHDGNGIRTTVFFKGCPLKCIWCHNPESISFIPEIAYYENKCINCGMCLNICENKAQKTYNGNHLFLRKNCIGCGECEKVCLGDAIKFYGKKYSVDELLTVLLEDKDFYETSGGGVTLSGGECLIQVDFCVELLKEIKKENIHTAIDTCGFIPKENISKVLPYTDVFLYDIKAIDENVHIKCTGQSNKIILENLKFIDKSDKNIEIRIPFIPGCNSNQIRKIAEFLKPLKNVTSIKVLPYHNYAGSKYEALNLKNTLPDILPTDEEIIYAENFIKKAVLKN